MAKQDDYVRMTLRMPAALHEALSAKAGAKSLNAEIVTRLRLSLSQDIFDEAMGGDRKIGLRSGPMIEAIANLRSALDIITKETFLINIQEDLE